MATLSEVEKEFLLTELGIDQNTPISTLRKLWFMQQLANPGGGGGGGGGTVENAFMWMSTQNTTNTAYDDMQYDRVVFGKENFSSLNSVKLRVVLQQENAGSFQVFVRLVDFGGTPVAGGELSVTLNQFGEALLETDDLKVGLTEAPARYRLQARTAAGGKVAVVYAALVTVSGGAGGGGGNVTGDGITDIVKITQATYDALATKDAETLYVIVD